MNARAVLGLILLAGALGGCAIKDGKYVPPRHGHPLAKFDECPGNAGAICMVTVKVDAMCRVSAEPELLFVRGRGNRSLIQWRLNGPEGVRFEDGSIVIHGNADRTFEGCRATGNGRQYQCFNNHQTTQGYKYDVRLAGTCGGQPLPVLDPFIMND